MVYLGSGANYELVPKLDVALYASVQPSHHWLQNFLKNHPSQRYENSFKIQPSKHKMQPNN